MPIYEYACQECGHEFEIIQKMSDSPLKVCPQCEKESLVKKMSVSGFALKGSGWYETDFKGKKPKAESCATAEVGACASGTCAHNH